MSSGEREASAFERGQMLGILPYIALGHYRSGMNFGLVEDGAVKLNSPYQHTAFSVSPDEYSQGWSMWGWEDAALSANGSFPESLSRYSDGFEIYIAGVGQTAIGHIDQDPKRFGKPLDTFQLVAVKNILWTAKLANLEKAYDYLKVKDDEDSEEVKILYPRPDLNIFRSTEESFSRLVQRHHCLQDLDRHFEADDENNSDSADDEHMLDCFKVSGEHSGSKVCGEIFVTPDSYAGLIDPIERVAYARLEFAAARTFVSGQGTDVTITMGDFMLDYEENVVHLATVDDEDDSIWIELNSESSQTLAEILNSLVPLVEKANS